MNKKIVALAGLLAVTIGLSGINYAGAQYYPPSGGGGGGSGTVGTGTSGQYALYNGTTSVAGDPNLTRVAPGIIGLGVQNSVQGGVILNGGTTGNQGTIQFYPDGSTAKNFIDVVAPVGFTTSSTLTLNTVNIKLPTSQGTTGQVVGYLDNAGTLGPVSAGGGSGTVSSGSQFQVPVYTPAGTSTTIGPSLMSISAGAVTIGNSSNSASITINDGAGHTTNIQTSPSQLSNVNFNTPITNSGVGNAFRGTGSGSTAWDTNANFDGNGKLALGVAGTSQGFLTLSGATSGTTTFTVPAVAGAVTITAPIVAETGATVQAAIANALDTVTTAGAHVYATACTALAGTLTAGRTGVATGILALVGTTSGTTNLTVPAAAGSVTVTLPTVAETGATVQAGVANAIDTLTTAGAHVYATACTALGGVITAGKVGTQGQVVLVGTTSGSATLTTPAVAGATTITMPAASLTFPAANAAGVMTNNGSGTLSYAASPISGFGGDGSDGALTGATLTKPFVNATTITVSTGITALGFTTQVWNATGAVSFTSGSSYTGGLGYGNGKTNTATKPATAGAGPSGGPASFGVSTNGGAGGGSNASFGAGGDGGGLTSATLLATALNSAGQNTGSVALGCGGGGGGGTGVTTGNGFGGGGGAVLKILAVGAISTAGTTAIDNSGSAGGAAGTTTGSGGGGGSGGGMAFYSRTSINLAAGTVTCKGGAGGAGGSTSGGGGGGGAGGVIVAMAPTAPTISLVTATAVAGGAAGTTVSGSNATAGSTGDVVSITATPNAPLISFIDKGGLRKITDHCHQTEIATAHGYELNQVQVSRWVSTNMQEYIACMETANTPQTHLLRVAPIELADEQRRIT